MQIDRETIIKLAREVYGENTKWEGAALERLEHLTKLVAEHRDKWWEEQVKVEVHEAVLDEREACAKVCEAQENRVVQRHPARIEFDPDSMMARKCAAAIRARGNHGQT